MSELMLAWMNSFAPGLFFMIEISVAISLTCRGQNRRKGKTRLILFGAAAEVLLTVSGSLLICLLDFDGFFGNFFRYLWFFTCSLIIFLAVYDEPPVTIAINGVCGYLMQHCASQIPQMTWNYSSYSELTSRYSHLKVMAALVTENILIFGVTYAFLYYFFIRRARNAPLTRKARQSFLQLSGITLLVILGLSSIRDYYEEESRALMLVSRLLSMFCCLLILYVRSGILSQVAKDAEMETVQRLRRMDHELYQEKKETVALINQKCHDMRHQIAHWEKKGMVTDPAELKKMRDLIRIYDASIKTGNETLDVVLTDRKLLCEQKQIQLNAMVDGRNLDFISEADLCSLFGNLLENAIEAVSSLPENQEKMIRLQVEKRHGMIIISEDNPYAGKLISSEGSFSTTKADPDYHGYGIRSMRMIAEKYGGQMNITTEEQFHVGIIIPCR